MNVNEFISVCMRVCVCVSDSADRNSDMMKQEVIRLQEMLNRLDFKRKVCILCHHTSVCCMMINKKSDQFSVRFSFLPLSGGPVQDGCCDQRDRRPDDHPAQPRAAGLEAKAADRRHRWSTAHQPGPTAELVTEGFFVVLSENADKLKMDTKIWLAEPKLVDRSK